MKIVGIDFTSAPRPRKPITLAIGRLAKSQVAGGELDTLHIDEHRRLPTLAAFEQWLATPDTWIGRLRLPFRPAATLPAGAGVGCDGRSGRPAARMGRHNRACRGAEPPELVSRCRAWTPPRPVGAKFAHRATDRAGRARALR